MQCIFEGFGQYTELRDSPGSELTLDSCLSTDRDLEQADPGVGGISSPGRLMLMLGPLMLSSLPWLGPGPGR